jgi:hypothetical protein
MNRRVIAFFGLFLWIASTGNGAENLASPQAKGMATIFLSKETPIQEVLPTLQLFHLKPLVLESDFVAGQISIHDFFIWRSDLPEEEAMKTYAAFRRKLVLDLLEGDPSAANPPDAVNMLQRNLVEYLQETGDDEILITKITTEGLRINLQALSQEKAFRGSRIEIAPNRPVFRSATIYKDEQSTQFKAVGTWYPNYGTTYVLSSSDTERFVTNYVRWDAPLFGASSTYEHDFLLNNINGNGTYLNSARTTAPHCMPQVLYAGTSFPASSYPYLDTRLDFNGHCNDSEVSFTIGIARADTIPAGETHFTHIRTTKGNVDTDSFKLQAQLGHRAPSNCYTTWCVYADATVNLVPAWDTLVPGITTWFKQ